MAEGAPQAVDMRVEVGGLALKNPVIAASGTFGYGLEMASYMDLNRLGGLVTKGVSLEPRAGNPPPRICETAGGMLNAIGLANIGLDAFIADKLSALAELDTCVIVNLYAESAGDFGELAARLDGRPGVAALELNVSCPNVKAGGMAFGVDPGAVTGAVAAARGATGLPLWVKLTPNVTSPVEIARAAEATGADAVSLINTIMGMAIDPVSRKPRLANVVGGLSGPAIKPVGLRMVWQVAGAVGIPVVGMGGIVSGSDAAEYMIAGATAVEAGTASFLDPARVLDIAEGLERFCGEQGVARVSELTGSLETPDG